ncbi:hypothetical protein H072_4067 [Dactylellina haptotyla CBS 200.50]|uniref:Uncharacterized protein n=1 Tax=Dactylellina haptotyla (strain CBS 200.50) TaxID=1284197 RepID=S8BRA1_DACHA|nr:hypothetical protein H072_4067 [Dactylellina haptotyla CBS 200.50]
MSLVKKFLLLPLFLQGFPSYGSPLPQNSGLTPQQICDLPLDDPNTWVNSGTAAFLDDFLGRTGPINWPLRIGQMTTPSGAVVFPNMRCSELTVGPCNAPSVLCNQVSSPQLYFVQVASGMLFSILNAFHSELQDNIIIETLGIGTIINDFGKPDDTFEINGVLSGSAAIASGLTAKVPLASAITGILSGIFGILAAAPKPENDPRGDIEQRLQAAFTQSREELFRVTSAVFGGTSDTEFLGGFPAPGAFENSDIARFFAGGRYLIPPNMPVMQMIRDIVDTGAVRIRQALVVRALKSQGYFVFIDEAVSRPEDCTPTGSRWINNNCYKITRDNRASFGGQAFEDLPRDTALKLDNAYYRFDVVAFYQNADACQNLTPGQDPGETQTQGLPVDGTLPQCFFNMKVRRGQFCGQLCSTVNGVCKLVTDILPSCSTDEVIFG